MPIRRRFLVARASASCQRTSSSASSPRGAAPPRAPRRRSPRARATSRRVRAPRGPGRVLALEVDAELGQVLERGAAQVHERGERVAEGRLRRRDGVGAAALARADLDDPDRLQRAQRLAQRRPADAELLAQLALAGQPLAGADAAGVDRLAQLLDARRRTSGPAGPCRSAASVRPCIVWSDHIASLRRDDRRSISTSTPASRSAPGGWATTPRCSREVSSANLACGFHAGDPGTIRVAAWRPRSRPASRSARTPGCPISSASGAAR